MRWLLIPPALLVLAAGAPFITRNGTSLLRDGVPFRFVGGNAYWLGLDENVYYNGTGIHYPTPFRILDALYTARREMGLSVLRGHTLGISTGNPLSFRPACGPDGMGIFNDSALDAADYALSIAGQLGLLVIVPLTDQYAYFHGGKHDFTDCWGLPPDAFFTDPRPLNAFKAYIRRRLAHVNPYTGLAASADPAILAWETGNELASPSPWTASVAAYIKSLDGNHLVMDGHYGVDPGMLSDKYIDIHSDHFYPLSLDKLRDDVALTSAHGKVYVAGEYAWTDVPGTAAFLAAVNATPAVAGSAFWSLFPHADAYGYVSHNDGFTVHYPGDTPSMVHLVQVVRDAAGAISGGALPPTGPPPQPLVTRTWAHNASVTWRGSAGAVNYSIAVSTAGADGPYVTACAQCGSDDALPLVVPGGLPLSSWVKVTPYGLDGGAGPDSPPAQVVA